MTVRQMLTEIVKRGDPFDVAHVCCYCNVSRYETQERWENHEEDCVWRQAVEWYKRQERS